jgi:hypothetical protein
MKTLVLITSVINISNVPLTYGPRSVYTKEERYEQTIKSIESVREKYSEADIFLVECSELKKEYEDTIKSLVKYYYNYNNSGETEKIELIRYSPMKALTEALLTQGAINYMINNNFNYDNLIKLNGRYYFNEHFDKNNFINDKIVVRYWGDVCATRLYKMPFSLISDFNNYLDIVKKDNNHHISYEIYYNNYINNYKDLIKPIVPIGVSGCTSVDAAFGSD